MPTSYTSFIEDGDVNNAADFLKLCVRAFGVAIKLRDEPLSTHIDLSLKKPNLMYYNKQISVQNKKLKIIQSLSDEEFFNQHINDQQNDVKKNIKKQTKTLQICLNIKKQIESINSYDPEFTNMIKFAVDQINLQIKECNNYIKYFKDIEETNKQNVSEEDMREFKKYQLCIIKNRIKNIKKDRLNEINSVNKENKFINKFNMLLSKIEE